MLSYHRLHVKHEKRTRNFECITLKYEGLESSASLPAKHPQCTRSFLQSFKCLRQHFTQIVPTFLSFTLTGVQVEQDSRYGQHAGLRHQESELFRKLR